MLLPSTSKAIIGIADIHSTYIDKKSTALHCLQLLSENRLMRTETSVVTRNGIYMINHLREVDGGPLAP